MRNVHLILFSLLVWGLSTASAQDGKTLQPNSKFNPQEAFAPFFYPAYGDEVRAADGTPGPKYWQNRADYKIDVSLDELTHTVSGAVLISYTNNSPQNLDFVWLQLDQNIYSKDSRGKATTAVSGGRWANRGTFNGGYEIESVTLVNGKKESNADFLINDTRMQIQLPSALKANAGKVQFRIKFKFVVPEYGTDRMGRLFAKDGWVYEVAQWYPRMCVYDNVNGWNTLPYLGQGEFYLEYGDTEFNINVPSGHVVVGSGELMNPKEVLTAEQQKRYAQAKTSDATVMLRTEAEVKELSGKASTERFTWKFKCFNTRDVAFATSKSFVWDAARINLPDGKTSLAMSVYPVECAIDNGWKRSTEFVKGSVEFYSKYLIPYSYPVATNVAGIVGGMEYPGIVFCSSRATGIGLWGVTSHEFGHHWFPMIVGTDERRFAWMDEGLNTFINGMADKSFNNGEFNRPTTVTQSARGAFYDTVQSIMNRADVVKGFNLGNLAYGKPGLGMDVLRQSVLGAERFDRALRYYAEKWSYKHPTPYDFFHCIENHSGESLDWFWRGWFLYNWKFDVAVTGVDYTEGKGSIITLVNIEKMPMPVVIEVTEANGTTARINLPVEVWQNGGTWKVAYPSTNKLTKVVLDPDSVTPDINAVNNTWKGQ